MKVYTKRKSMTQTRILQEFSQLPLQQQLQVVQATLYLFTQQVKNVTKPVDNVDGSEQLAVAANILLDDYLSGEELTTFTALDGEPFYTEVVRYG